ncbi:MAG: glycerol-3-phosphate 1-O-acyltransferase PlsY [Acidimicrobiia bacterium]
MEFETIAVVLGGYLLGSVDFGVILPRLRGVDIYEKGSGNPGASNVLRSMGRGMAGAVVVGDLAKGFVAAMAGELVVGEVVGFASGFAAVLGHCFPIWHRFHGGKGVSAAAGVIVWLEPLAGVGFLVAWALMVAATKKASIASIIVAVSLVPVLAAFGHRGWALVWAGAIVVLIVIRHQANIRRLLDGSEFGIEEPA